MEFDVIMKAVSDVNEKLSCKIEFEQASAANCSPKHKTGLSYYDSERDVVVIREKEVHSDKDIIIGTIYALVSEKGLKGILGDKYNDFCIFLANGMSRHTRSMSYSQQLNFGENLLQNMNMDTADFVCRHFCKTNGLEYSDRYVSPFRAAVAYFQRSQVRKMVELNDADSLDLEFKKNIIENSDSRYLQLGMLSDAYRRIGYPETGIIMINNLSSLIRILANPVNRQNILSANFIDKVQNPLAIIDKSTNGKEYYAVVLDIRSQDGQYLTLNIPSPDSMVKLLAEGGPGKKLRVTGIGQVSPENLLRSMLPKEGVNKMKYLQSTLGPDSSSFALSRILKHVKDHPAKEYPLSPTYLNLIEKEIDLFRNPMSSDKFRLLYGMSREERMRLKQEEELSAMAALSAVRVNVTDEAAVIRRPEQKSFRQRLSARPTASRFGDTVIRKMTADGIMTAEAIISLGEAAVRERYGPRALRTAVAFLGDNGLDFDCIRRHDSLTAKMELEKMSPDMLEGSKYEDLFRTLSAVPDNIGSVSIPMPVTERGNYIGGADAVALVAKMASTPRWQGSNIFITREEADRHGLAIDPLAIATVVERKGKNTVMYNIADTSLRDNPEKLKDTVERISSHTLSASAYMTTLLSSLRSTRKDMVRDLYGHFQTMYNAHVKEGLVGRKVPSLNAVAKEQPKEKICLDRLDARMKTFAREELIPEMKKKGIPVKNIKELVETGMTTVNAKGIRAKVFFNSTTVYAQDITTNRSFGDFLQNLRSGTRMTTARRGRPEGKGNSKDKEQTNGPKGPGGGPHK